MKFAVLAVLAVLLLTTTLATTSCTGEDDAAAPSIGTPAASPAGLVPNATISKVIDGDTVIADVNGSRENVRLIGIDTPGIRG